MPTPSPQLELCQVRFAASGSSRSLRPVGAGPTQSLVVSCNSDANRAAWLGALRRETARCVAMEGEFTLQSDKVRAPSSG